jgi:Mrp family chromosome partitioning ATPase
MESARVSRQVLSQVHTKLIGIVLNQVSFKKIGYGSYYYNNYHYYSDNAA